MEKIDLTKCVNCRFRAEISNSGPVSGRIVVDKGVYLVDEKGDIIGFLSLDGEDIMSMSGRGITNFEIVPRDPEAYRDWQVWDTVEYSDNYSTGRIIFRGGDFVAADIEGTCNCYTCDELFNEGYRLVLTDIENQIIEEKRKQEYEPQDGDIVAWKDEEDDGDSAVSIYKAKHRSYITLFTTGSCYVPEGTLAMGIARPATEEEKQKLFDAMANEGKRWNAEKKVVEDIPKPYEFKKGEPVLVRGHERNRWMIAAYSDEDSVSFLADTGKSVVHWKYCLPYNERTMHLLGTSDKEGEK